MSASEEFKPMPALPTKVRARRFLNAPWGTLLKSPAWARKLACTPAREHRDAVAVKGVAASEERAARSIRGLWWALLFAVPLSTGIASADENAATREETLTSLLARRMGRAGGLTATDVARRATATSYELRAGERQIDAARAHVDSATIQFAPRLELIASYTRLSNIDPPSLGNVVLAPTAGAGPLPPGTPLVAEPLAISTPLNHTTLEAVLIVPVSDYILKISQNRAGAKHSERAAQLNAQALDLKIRADARLAYYAWARVRLSVTVSEEGLEQVRLHLRDARSLFRNGAASSADVARVESQLATNERLVADAKSLEQVGVEQLQTIMHDRATRSWEIGEDFAPALSDDELTDLEALLAQSVRARPEVRALGETEASIIQERMVARADVFPKLDVSGEITTADPNERYLPNQSRFDTTWSAGFKLSWSPNESLTSAARGRELLAKADEVAAQRAAVIDGLRLEVSRAIQGWTDARVAVETTARSLAAAEESYRQRRSLFLNQRATSAELLDAELDLLRVRLDDLNALIDQRIAKVRLEHATGEDALGAP
jgi:outer membrane protein